MNAVDIVWDEHETSTQRNWSLLKSSAWLVWCERTCHSPNACQWLVTGNEALLNASSVLSSSSLPWTRSCAACEGFYRISLPLPQPTLWQSMLWWSTFW